MIGGSDGLYYLKPEAVKEHSNPIYRDNRRGGHDHQIQTRSIPHYRLIFIKKL